MHRRRAANRHSREMVKPVENFLADCGHTLIESPAEAKSYIWAMLH